MPVFFRVVLLVIACGLAALLLRGAVEHFVCIPAALELADRFIRSAQEGTFSEVLDRSAFGRESRFLEIKSRLSGRCSTEFEDSTEDGIFGVHVRCEGGRSSITIPRETRPLRALTCIGMDLHVSYIQ